jgi:outer membrane cobalamin receptor
MQIKKILLMGILCASIFCAQGQKLNKSSLKGQVSDELKKGIPYATVKLVNGNKTVATDQQGNYQFTGLSAGSYTIQISAVGFKKAEQKIILKESEERLLNFSLQDAQHELNSVAINGKTKVTKIKESGFAVNSIELKHYANTTNDLNQILNRSSGIKVREQGGLGSDFQFMINGLSGGHIKFFIDGIPLESYGSGMTLNNIPVNLAERVDVYKGVVPAFLGSDALGGAVNIVTRKNKGKSLDVSYSLGSFNTHRAGLTGSFTDKKSGITTNVNSYYNFSDNDYYMYNNPKANVKLRVPTEDLKDYINLDKIRRFHDGYETYMGQIESGVTGKKWADVLVVGLTYTHNFKERQTGANQERVIGKITEKGNNLIPSIRYRKENLFVKGLSASVFANFSANKNIVTDTAGAMYAWDGRAIPRTGLNVNLGSELSGEKKSISHLTGHNALAQLNLGYAMNEHHTLSLNHNYNRAYRESYNEIDPYDHSFDRSNALNKNITGLSYQQSLFGDRLNNNIFGKSYHLGGEVYDENDVPSKQNKQYYGYGIASSYKLTENIGVKASFEHAYRLPSLVELYGNRVEILGNPNLKPESSDNYNVGLYFNKTLGKGRFWAEASTYYRDANDFITPTPSSAGSDGSYSQSFNADGIIVNGLDAEVRYEYDRLFSVIVNMTYQNAVNRQKYARGTTREDIRYLSRIPNQPWLYGNFDLSIGKDNLIGKDTRLQFNWYTQFVNDYSTDWSKLGSPQSNTYIPQQWIQNATLTYSRNSGKYNISLESRNLTNMIAYDQFKLQKPGRSFFVKLRYAIQQN